MTDVADSVGGNALGLDGKNVVVTGGTTGIGLTAAQDLASIGATVYVMGRRERMVDEAKELLGTRGRGFVEDVADLADLDKLFATVASDTGVVDILVTCAGVSDRVVLDDATPQHFDRVFDINVRGTYFAVQKALPLMTRGGAIVMTSSAMAGRGVSGFVAYAASKSAIRSFALSMSTELGPRGIRVNTISPGVIDTPILAPQYESREAHLEAVREFSAPVNLGRCGSPSEVATGIRFLATEASSYVNGIDLIVDGER